MKLLYVLIYHDFINARDNVQVFEFVALPSDAFPNLNTCCFLVINNMNKISYDKNAKRNKRYFMKLTDRASES